MLKAQLEVLTPAFLAPLLCVMIDPPFLSEIGTNTRRRKAACFINAAAAEVAVARGHFFCMNDG
jgi:hypothetical protein